MTTGSESAAVALRDVALQKMVAVLGRERAERLLAQILAEHDLVLHTADDLYTFAMRLQAFGGFEGAVGAMLGVTAVMRGASGPR